MSQPPNPPTTPMDPAAQPGQPAQPAPPAQPVPPGYADPARPEMDPRYAAGQQYHPAEAGRARTGPGLVGEASRFARHLRTPETKEFFKTSEFFVTILGALILILAAAIQDNFDAPQMWRLFTALLVAYIISWGIAKAGALRGD